MSMTTILFVILWFPAAAANMWVGLYRAGCSFREELPIFSLMFLLLATVAARATWKLLCSALKGHLSQNSQRCRARAARESSGSRLPSIAPDDFGDADHRQDHAVNCPMKVTDHEADAEGEVEALKSPDGPHEDHRNADQATDNPHHNIEWSPHRFPPASLGAPIHGQGSLDFA